MTKTSKIAGTKRVLTTVAMATLWLAGAGGGWAADAPVSAPAKPPETPAAAADETVVLDDATMWRIYRVEGPQHIRATDGKLIAGAVRSKQEQSACRHTGQQNPPGGGASASGFCGKSSILPPADWAGLTMDDCAWPRFRFPQPSVFAQGGPGNHTVRLERELYSTALVLARARFEVKDPARVKACRLSLIYWGGVVVYVNGKEVARGSLPGQPSDWGDPAEDYPEDVFLTPKGKPLECTDVQNRDRLEKRNRRLSDVAIPAGALRAGVNVIAIEMHPAPVNAKTAPKAAPSGHELATVPWPPIGLLSARLAVVPAGSAKPVRPGGVQVWNAPTSDKISVFDYGNPLDPLQPLVIRAARNTVFSSRLMVGSDRPIKGLKATVTDLGLISEPISEPGSAGASPSQGAGGGGGRANLPVSRPPSGGGKISASAVRVRYAVPATPDKSWVSPNEFDGLFDAIPAEIPVSQGVPGWDRSGPSEGKGTQFGFFGEYYDMRSGNAKVFYHFTPDRTALTGRAVAPLWFTVKVPREAPAGVYEGQVSISADGLAEVRVPLRVHVSAWTAPDVRDYCLQNYLFQSEESVMSYYGESPYSDRHLELVGKSLALGAELNQLHVEANLVINYQGGSFQSESLVRWIEQPDGTYKHDFTNFDRYLNMVAKAIGTPRVLTLNHFGGPIPYDVTCLDPATGRLEALRPPQGIETSMHSVAQGWDSNIWSDVYVFWKPVYDEILKKLKARGWLEQTTLGAQCRGGWSDPPTVFLAHRLWPGAEWSFTSHFAATEFFGVDPTVGNKNYMAAAIAMRGGRNAEEELKEAGLSADQIVIATVRHSDTVLGRLSPTRPLYFGPRRNVMVACPRSAIWGSGENLPEVRRMIQGTVQWDGCGEQGLDLFPLKTKFGDYTCSPARLGSWWQYADVYMRALLYPGPEGPVATERFEMFREGLELTELKLFLERAVAEKKVSAELLQRVSAVLEERSRWEKSGANDFYYRCFQSEADAKLLDMADEVERAMPFTTNTPASELAAVVERVAANPSEAGNCQQVWRLRAVTSALTPAQLGRLYACLKTEPKARFELTELVAVLGRAFGARCGGDEGKLGQLLGDANALPFLRSYAQAAAESTNAALKAWARTDGAILLPLANGLRAQYYGRANTWEGGYQERLVETLRAPDQQLGLSGFDFGENKWVSISVRWTGFLEVKTPGKYTFHALADDAARLWVDDTLLTESYKSDDGVAIELAAGFHPFKVEYWKGYGQCSIAMTWSGPGFERQPIGADVVRTPAVEQKK